LVNSCVDSVPVKIASVLNQPLLQFISVMDVCLVNTFLHGRPYSQLGRGVGCLESTNPAYFYVALLQFSSPFSAQTLLVGRLEEHPACKNVGCLFVGTDSLTGALHILYLQFVATTSFILSSSEIHNGDIVVPAYPYCPGKWLLNEHSFTFAVSQARCPSALSY